MKQIVTAVVIGGLTLTTVWLSLIVATKYLFALAVLLYL